MKRTIAQSGEAGNRLPGAPSQGKGYRLTMALLAFLGAATGLPAAPQTITNDVAWHDTGGHEIIAHTGSMIKVGGIYYWYGHSIVHDTIRCYSSTDLKHWTFIRVSYRGPNWHGRPMVLYNRAYGNYVMITESPESPRTARGRNAIAYLTSPSPTNVFTLQHVDDTVLGGFAMGDHGVFQDTDGSAYLLATTDENGITNGSFKVIKLASDYLRQDSVVMSWNTRRNKREAPFMLKVGTTYYLFTSRCVGWDSSQTEYWKSSNLGNKNGWSDLTPVGTVPPSRNSFNTQHDFEITVTGSQGTSYIYVGDRWAQYTKVGVGPNAWYPLTFDNHGNPEIHGLGQWSIDVATGLWSGNTIKSISLPPQPTRGK